MAGGTVYPRFMRTPVKGIDEKYFMLHGFIFLHNSLKKESQIATISLFDKYFKGKMIFFLPVVLLYDFSFYMIQKFKDQLINILQNIPLFNGLDEQGLVKILNLLQPIEMEKGAPVVMEGTDGNSMFIIMNGSVDVFRTQESGDKLLIDILTSGDFFGEFALIDKMPRSADVICREGTMLLQLTKDNLDQLLNESEKIALVFYRNCLMVTFSRFRNMLTSFTDARYSLDQTSAILDELNEDLSHARKVQSYFINTDFLDNERYILPSIKQSYLYNPCLEIGGDFLYMNRLSDTEALVLIADVEGHGITASLGTGVLRSALASSIDRLGNDPVGLMTFLNNHFYEVLPNLYATCYCLVINSETSTIDLVKAGHHHPLIWQKEKGDFADVESSGPALGIIKGASYRKNSIQYNSGDFLLFYTDGILEQRNPLSEMYGSERLLGKIKQLILDESDEKLPGLYEDLNNFASDEEMEDDVTLYLLEFQ